MSRKSGAPAESAFEKRHDSSSRQRHTKSARERIHRHSGAADSLRVSRKTGSEGKSVIAIRLDSCRRQSAHVPVDLTTVTSSEAADSLHSLAKQWSESQSVIAKGVASLSTRLDAGGDRRAVGGGAERRQLGYRKFLFGKYCRFAWRSLERLGVVSLDRLGSCHHAPLTPTTAAA